ncbi:MAG: biopolymer transporter ExbD [Pirellulales bacterium]|nr:biopolymer transporter ExbD [Pirellulales bacterium]
MTVSIKKGRALSTLSLTPLIDVVFLLLIFFLVATRFEEEERSMEVELAESSQSLPLTAQPKTIFINVLKSGKYMLSRQEYTEQGLLDYLKSHNSQPVVIRPDRGVIYDYVVKARHACRAAGIHDFKEAVINPGSREQ